MLIVRHFADLPSEKRLTFHSREEAREQTAMEIAQRLAALGVSEQIILQATGLPPDALALQTNQD